MPTRKRSQPTVHANSSSNVQRAIYSAISGG